MSHAGEDGIMLSLRSMRIPVVFVLVSLIMLASHALAQETEKPMVVIEIDKTTVYRGYQSIEVKAYIITDGRPSLEKAVATLNAGVKVEVELPLVRLAAPVEVTVGNETYTTRYIALAKVPVPAAVSVGIAKLTVTVEGSVGNETFSKTETYDIRVLNQRPVEDARFTAYLALERAMSLLYTAQALGIDVSEEAQAVTEAENALRMADDNLFVREMVEDALKTYEDVSASLERTISSIVVKLSGFAAEMEELATRIRAIEKSVSALEESTKSLASELETLSRDIGESLNTLREGLANYGSTLSRLSKSVNDAITSLAVQVNTLSDTVSKLSSDTNKAFDNLAKSISEIDSKVNRIAESQQALVSTMGALQNSILAVAVILLIIAAIYMIVFKRMAQG